MSTEENLNATKDTDTTQNIDNNKNEDNNNDDNEKSNGTNRNNNIIVPKNEKLKIESVAIKDTNIENGHVYYNIQVKTAQQSWTVQKRYHQFYELHSQLSNVSKKELPFFPSKYNKLLTDHHDPEFIKQRRALLDNYIKKLMKLNEISQSQLVINFFHRSDHSSMQKDEKDGKDDEIQIVNAQILIENNDNNNNSKNTDDCIVGTVKIDDEESSNEYEFPEDQEVTHVSIQTVKKMTDHHLYQISATNANTTASSREWTVLKRFTQFYDMDVKLREDLAKDCPSVLSILPPPPPRKFKFFHDHMDRNFVEERRVLLEHYLTRLLRIPQAAKNKHLVEFLGVTG